MPCAATRVVIVPGNGCDGTLEELRSCNFYGAAETGFHKSGCVVAMQPMPDPLRARESVWVPFILNQLGADTNTVLIGHSSGAAAALRVAEKTKLRGLVLVAAYDDSLGDELEEASGYFSRPFDWPGIANNCGFIIQFAGTKDRLVPIAVQRRVAHSLGSAVDYRELPLRDHFFSPPFDELLHAVQHHLQQADAAALEE